MCVSGTTIAIVWVLLYDWIVCLDRCVWIDLFGSICLDRLVWIDLFGAICLKRFVLIGCLDRFVWTDLFGSICLGLFVWVDSFGSIRFDRLVWIDLFGSDRFEGIDLFGSIWGGWVGGGEGCLACHGKAWHALTWHAYIHTHKTAIGTIESRTHVVSLGPTWPTCCY